MSTTEWQGPQRLRDVPWEALDGIRAPILTALAQVLEGSAAERVLDRLLRGHRAWTSVERRVAAESLFGVGLWRRRLRSWDPGAREPSALLAALLWDLGGLDSARAQQLAGALRPPEAGPGPSTWAEAWSVPDWLAEHTVTELGEAEAERFWASLVTPGPTFFRANLLKTSAEQLQASLAAEGIETSRIPFASSGLRVTGTRPNILGSRAHQAGHFEVQDLGSQLLGMLVEARPGERVLDLCAGAGGKTLLLASEAGEGATIDAWDLEASRLQRLRTRAQRAGALGVRVLGTAPVDGGYDRVLVDAPCSELGTLRRGPDLRWRLTPVDLERYVEVQASLLEAGARNVRPGGRLVYATCTLHRAENQAQLERFELAHPQFRRERPGDGWLPEDFLRDDCFLSLPHLHDTDGFFAAVYTRLR